MIVRDYLRTIDLAQAGHISVQQVRNYEASGLIPPAERSPSGYRRYTQKHRGALETARSLVDGYGWQRTRTIMQAVHQDDLPAALALIDERHAELTRNRVQIEQTMTALSMLAVQSAPLTTSRHAQRLRVGVAATQVGVRVSALRFWEQQGLLHPERDTRSGYRLYDAQQMRRLRVVVLLRDAGYDFNAIRTTLDELAAGQPAKAIAAVERRRAEIAKTSWSCLGALTMFHEYIRTFWPERYPRVTRYITGGLYGWVCSRCFYDATEGVMDGGDDDVAEGVGITATDCLNRVPERVASVGYVGWKGGKDRASIGFGGGGAGNAARFAPRAIECCENARIGERWLQCLLHPRPCLNA